MILFRRLLTTLALALLLGGCERAPTPPPPPPKPLGPAEALTRLMQDLRRNDLAGYARHAVPPALHRRLAVAWQQGHTVWPLTELPLDDRIAPMITALAAPGAERRLTATFKQQFSGAGRELRSAAATLGLFAGQYVTSAEEYSDEERDHYLQMIAAFSQWGQRAPLAEGKRASAALPRLIGAARGTGLGGDDAFPRAGMDKALGRLGPFLRTTKDVLRTYDLDLDATLDSVHPTLAEQTGDTARLRVRYTLAGRPIDAYVRAERRDGQWYMSDLLRHAEAEAAKATTPDAAPGTDPAAPATKRRKSPPVAPRQSAAGAKPA
ncbi:hypothetical protein [Aerolutibacter ruishenii]|uniref:Lipoprotein n=1 Tax=Aerolutibacter ruishenii TaxID=686800 RepID=A0A562M098_9GAMM|nr:hypothetical protein [Lysobacter ruishenii]TWI13364.1 hypothetical protein IP93_00526 [Lysobacter ruishenii]